MCTKYYDHGFVCVGANRLIRLNKSGYQREKGEMFLKSEKSRLSTGKISSLLVPIRDSEGEQKVKMRTVSDQFVA